MIESILGPDVLKKLMAKLSSLLCAILAWIGLVMVMMNSFYSSFIDLNETDFVTIVRINHPILWPMLIGFFCAAIALILGDRKIKIVLSCMLFLLSLWVMVSTIMGWLPVWPPICPGLGLSGSPPLLCMIPLTIVGGCLGVMGGLVGYLGAYRYLS